MYRVPLLPAPSTPIVSLVTLLAPLTVDRSIFQASHTAFATSVASPLYATLVLLIFRYSWPVLPSTPRK